MTSCSCPYCPNRILPEYRWDRVHRVIAQVRNGNISTPGAIAGLQHELSQMSEAHRSRVFDEVGAELEAIGVL